MSDAIIEFDTGCMKSYRQFIRLRSLPVYRWQGTSAVVPAEYADQMGLSAEKSTVDGFDPLPCLFDYQRDIARIALQRQRFAVFADCGLGKTMIELEFARHVSRTGPVLMVAPLMVVRQTIEESQRFYGDNLPVQQVAAKDLSRWLDSGNGVGITNWDALRGGMSGRRLKGLILDESSMLKSHYGKFGREAIRLGRGVPYKLALTGTPAPNDRIEYANHSVFLDVHRTTNEFLAKYFINRGQTQNRWEIKPHALRPFYRDLSHWCIFLSDPSVYGWKDNCSNLPPIRTHIEHVDLTPEQQAAVQKITGCLMPSNPGGITTRSKLGQIAKGRLGKTSIPTLKPSYIAERIAGWQQNESTLVWCKYNPEQELLEREMPDAASITGATRMEQRSELIDAFKSGEVRTLISKPDILGFGLNLQVATRQVFSALEDSYEKYYQAIKRSNRIGSTKPLDVHIPVTQIEEVMIANVLRKADRVEHDTREQESLFREAGYVI